MQLRLLVDAVDDMLPLGPQLALLEATLLADLRECCRRLQVMFSRKLRENSRKMRHFV
jgi:hypothetical protein